MLEAQDSLRISQLFHTSPETELFSRWSSFESLAFDHQVEEPLRAVGELLCWFYAERPPGRRRVTRHCGI